MTSLGSRVSLLAASASVVAALGFCSPAGAVTVGQTTPGTILACGANVFFVQAARAAASASYTIPPGGGVIDSWSTGTKGATGGEPITLLVLKPRSSTTYEVVTFDNETIPNPPPAGNIASFSLPNGLAVPGGAVLGLYTSSNEVGCSFSSGPEDTVGYGASPAPTPGATETQTNTAGGALLNVAVDLVQSMDGTVAQSATPSAITAGGVGLLNFTVSNAGPSAGGVTLTDDVPNGLSILAAFMGSGACSTTAQHVVCTTSQLAPGSSVGAGVVVSAAMPGVFVNTGALATEIADTNAANNSASATLTVAPVPETVPPCRVVALKRVPLGEAKAALRALGCRVGKVTKRHSRRIPKGEVISTSPGPSVQPPRTAVNVVQSSGKRKKRRHHR